MLFRPYCLVLKYIQLKSNAKFLVRNQTNFQRTTNNFANFLRLSGSTVKVPVKK